ncbi:MAG: cellulase family glycosylhydrolase [Bacteroidaceae bacterium]|nr:cellulase family glycosylhydrolase [Bacteroidaceae bacterium]
MKKLSIFTLLLCLIGFCACNQPATTEAEFVTVKDGKFFRGDKEYRYVGANFWYGAILGSEGRGGNRERLLKELDLMKETGITTLRVLVGADGRDCLGRHISPILQSAPGEYNDTILQGLDFLLSELEKRQMTATLYLNNAWEWSGGFGAYLEWAGCGPAADPEDWDGFLKYHCQFVQNDKAKEFAANHVRYIVGRTNTITGKPYTQSPAILAWELANEPRAFAGDSITKACFAQWVKDQASLIKSIDANHLVTTGSEGLAGCELDADLFREVHSYPEIDFICIHIWPYNWHWVGPVSGPIATAKDINGPTSVIDNIDNARRQTENYLNECYEAVKDLNKPMILEEFGYPRDNYTVEPGTPTTGRDLYYQFVFDLVRNSGKLAGCSFWGWGGLASELHYKWQPWDDYTCDPAFEEQGLNSVFAADISTMRIIREFAGQ